MHYGAKKMKLCHPVMSWVWMMALSVLVSDVTSQQPLPCNLKVSVPNNVLTVTENSPPNTVVATVVFVGPSITLSAGNNVFYNYTVNNTEMIITVKKSIDAETDLNIPNFVIVCVDTATKADVKQEFVTNVIDVNEFPPKFSSDTYTATISEYAAVGSTVTSDIRTTDLDRDRVLSATYRILTSEYSDRFEMNISSLGVVTVTKSLKFDRNIVIPLTIEAKDGGNPPLYSNATLLVSVVDVDDEPPIFTQPSYTGTIDASAKMGDVVKLTNPILAVDGDKGLNATVVYSTSAVPGVQQRFAINNTTAVVTLITVGLVSGQIYVVIVKATQQDNPERVSVVSLAITAQGTTDTTVQFAFTKPEYSASIPENQPSGGAILTVKAETNDQNFPVYNIVEGSTIREFAIDDSTGIISLKSGADIDYERQRQYEFTVRSVLIAKLTSQLQEITAKVVINIINVNDNDPKFGSNVYNFKASGAAKGAVIGRVNATDADGDRLTYSIKSYPDVFAVNGVSGDVTLLVDLRSLMQDTYSVVVAVTDNGQPPREATTTVNVVFGNGTAATRTATDGSSGDWEIIPLIVIAVLCGLFVLIIIILIVCIIRRNSQLKREKARKQNIGNLSIFGDSCTNLNEDPATTVQENPLAMDNPGYFYMMKSGMSDTDPSLTNDYMISEVPYPQYANGSVRSILAVPNLNGTLSRDEDPGKRAKTHGQNTSDRVPNGAPPADPKITVYF